MTPERWQQVKELLGTALELDPDKRPGYLDQACGNDASLRNDLERLLVAEQKAGPEFLSDSVILRELTLKLPKRADAWIGRRLGPYQIVEEISAGGMGEVYRAVRADEEYRKQVAIKLVRSGQDSGFVLNRFKNERQILATLDHPNIARLIDGGTTEEGLPYFVMELIQGRRIDEYCDVHKLTTGERLKLFLQMCSAVQYAHQRLIIHRDIKPGNSLGDAEGVPKLLDFGIAKILESAEVNNQPEQTISLVRLLTPGYASPEQVKGEPITTSSDVYSLGVVLYELLTGRSPYNVSAHTPHEITRAVCEFEAEKPSTAVSRKQIPTGHRDEQQTDASALSAVREGSPEKLSKRLSGDLDNIVLMALRKEPQRRYATVEQFAQDIRRHLDHLPVIARKDTFVYRTSKFIRRHKAGVAAAALVTVALLCATGVTLRQARIAQRRFNDVRQLSNSLIFEIHDSIQNLPGATPARKLLLERALRYLDGLAKESAGDISLQRELAAGYQRIGQLQGYSLDANLGQTEAAITSLQKALTIAEAVAKANPNNVSDQLRAANAHRILSSMFNNSGRPGAREQVEQALAISDRLLKLDGSNPEVQLERSVEYEDLSYFQDDSGDFAGAAISLRNAMVTIGNLWKADPQNKKLQISVAINRVRLGNELANLGSRDEALQVNRSGLDIYELLAKDQTDARSRRQLAVTLWFRGSILMINGDFSAALEIFRRSLVILREMEKADPKNVLYQLDVAGATAAVGRALAKTGKSAEGLAMLGESIRVYEENYARDHSYTDIPNWLGQDHIWKGEVLSGEGNVRAALEEYRKGAASLEILMTGSESPNTRADIAASYLKVGAALAETGNKEDAVTSLSKALKIAEPLALAKPPHLLALYVAADAYHEMGNLSQNAAPSSQDAPVGQRQRCGEARDWYRKSVGAWQQIPNPARTTPSGFAVGDPENAVKELRRCDALLQ